MSEGVDRGGVEEARQAGLLVWGSVAAKLSEAIAPLIIARVLGKAEYGAFGALMLVYATLTMVLSAGLPRALLLFFADASAGQRRTIFVRLSSLCLVLGLVDALLLVSIGWGSGQFLLDVGGRIAGSGSGSSSALSALEHLPWLGLFALFDLPTRCFPNFALAMGRARVSALAGLLRSVGMLLATALPAALGWGVPGMIAALCVFGAVHQAIYAGFAWRSLGSGPTESSSWTLAAMGRYAAVLGATEVVNVLNAHLDQLLILLVFSLERLAEYRNGAWQIPVVTTIAYSVGAVQLPRLTRLFAAGRGAEALEVWREAAKKASRVVIPLALIFVISAEDLMILAFGESYRASGQIFACYALLTMARVTAFGSFLVAAGRPGDLLRAAAATLGFNAALSIPALLVFGFVGPALGTLVAFVPTVWVYCLMIARASGKRVRDTFPLFDYLSLVALAVPGALITRWVVGFCALSSLGTLAVSAFIVPASFVVLGRASGRISRQESAYVREWISLRVMNDPPRRP